jgi:membrane protease YdiL (CAAX protease family)
VNAFVEEVFWRGIFIRLWPSDPVRGWLWPAVGFALWHFAPQAIHRSSLGTVPFVLASLALGLSFGWVAWRSGTLRWVTPAHVLVDGSGIRSALFFLP